MKRYSMVIAVIAMIGVLLFNGCGTPAPAPAPAPSAAPAPAPAPAPKPAPTAAPAPTSAPAPAPAAKAIKLSFSLNTPYSGHLSAQALRPWLKQLEDATKNRVQFDVYYDSTLSKQDQTWQAVMSGIADVGLIVHATYPGLTPRGEVVTLPWLSFTTGKDNSIIYRKLFDKFQSIRDEFKPNKVLVVYGTSTLLAATSKKQIKVMEDFKGLKLKVGGGPRAAQIKGMGAVPVTMPAGDIYMNIQKGVIDGTLSGWDSMASFKNYEVLKYYTNGRWHAGNFSIVMNMAKWNSLPKDIQDAINSKIGPEASEFWGYNQWDTAEVVVREEVKKAGWPMEEYIVPEAEIQRMVDAVGKPLYTDWVKNMKAAGRSDAQEILDAYIQFQKEMLQQQTKK